METAPLAATYRLKKGYRWCCEKKQWISPKARIPKDIKGILAFLCVQKSPSSIATCRICGKLIARGEYRFAWPLTDPRGQYGAISAWFHSECANVLIPQLFQKWRKLEKSGWPEFELEEEEVKKENSTEGGEVKKKENSTEGGEVKNENSTEKSLPRSPPRSPPLVSEVKVEKTDGVTLGRDQGVSADQASASESSLDCIESMTLELWLEIYCAHWSDITSSDSELKAKLLKDIETPIKSGVEDELTTTSAQHMSRILKPIDSVPGMCCNLLPFQKEGIAWMVYQEHNVKTFGGILADEMGMGKTIQTIGCILLNRVYGTKHQKREEIEEGNWQYPPAHSESEINRARRVQQEELKRELEKEEEVDVIPSPSPPPPPARGGKKGRSAIPKSSPKVKAAAGSSPAPKRMSAKEKQDLAAAKKSALSTSDKCRIDEAPEIDAEGATLVIAPLAAVLQWESELNKFAQDLNVLIYHGPNRSLLTEELERADVVITTYPTIEADYRSVVSKHKLKCQYCGKMFLPSKLRLHLRDMCGPDAVRTARQALRERKQESTKAKAMETLHIGKDFSNTIPTVSNIYKEIMHTAGRHEEAEDFSGAAWLRPIRRKKIINEDDREGGTSDEQRDEDAEQSPPPPHSEKIDEGDHQLTLSSDSSEGEWQNTRLFRDASGRSADDTDDEEDSCCSNDSRLLGTPRVVCSRDNQSLHASPPNTKEEISKQMPVASATNQQHAPASVPALGEKGEKGEGGEELAQTAPPLTPPRKRVSSSTTKKANDFRPPTASPITIAPTPSDYEAWAKRSTDSQIRKSKVDILRAVIETLNPDLDMSVLKRKADLVQQLLDWRSQNIETPEVSPPKKARRLDPSKLLPKGVVGGKEEEEEEDTGKSIKGEAIGAVVRKENGLETSLKVDKQTQPAEAPPPMTRGGRTFPRNASRPLKPVNENGSVTSNEDSLSDEPSSSSSSPLETSSSDVVPDESCSSDDSMSDIVVPDESAPASERADDSVSSSLADSADLSEDSEVEKKTSYFKRYGGGKKGKKGKKGGGGGFGGIHRRIAGDLASNAGMSDASTVDMNFIDLSSSPLHSVKWNRIVLDEAHRIKSHTTNTCKSVFALKSCGTRWCLTGTPLQNRIHELYSLLRFLQFFPYAYYFCSKKDCACSTLNYSFEGGSYCVTCGHTKMNHYSYFNRKIAKPIISYGVHGEGGLALETLRKDVLSMVLLRRTKVERAADVNLPPLDVFIRREELSQPEMDFYESLYKQSKTKFDTYTVAGTILHNFAHVFDLLSRLRQAVDHPYMIIHGSLAVANEQIPSHSHSSNEVCGICQEDIEQNNYYKSTCDHHFDISCLDEYILEAPENTKLGCPVCYQSLSYTLFNKITQKPVILENPASAEDILLQEDDNLRSNPIIPKHKASTIMSRINPREFQTSTKIEVLLQEIEASPADSKAIVFSQFTNFLYLIDFKLKKQGVKCAVFTGSLSMESRQNIILNFNKDPDLKVILISLKAGGEGLNLQIANQIYLMDPWWNPAAEQQAIQRAHRIGQTKPVRAVRIIAKNTIEERILQLQERKQLVFDGTVNNSNQAFQKLSADDLKFLFQ